MSDESPIVRATHVIAVGNQKGGVGKTTTCCHLASIKQLATAIFGEDEEGSHSSNRHETCFGGYEWQHTLYR